MTQLTVEHLHKRFPVGGSSMLPWRKQAPHLLHAVDDVSFQIAPGESVGLVGESGCGKSTLVRLLNRLIDPTEGGIRLGEADLAAQPAAGFARHPSRKAIQMVFQDPTDSLNPRFTAFDTIAEPLRRLEGIHDKAQLTSRINELARQVGLPEELLPRYPHQLSGGQKARVGIARAISVKPQLLILDEPTAALDVSVQAVILHLLADLREQLGMSYLFVSHDLNIVRLLCDRVLVMYLGKIIESGPAQAVFAQPRHPYTQALISAIPQAGGAASSRIRMTGEPRSPINPSPQTCRFYGRCPKGEARCQEQMPVLQEMAAGHEVACHFPVSGR